MPECCTWTVLKTYSIEVCNVLRRWAGRESKDNVLLRKVWGWEGGREDKFENTS